MNVNTQKLLDEFIDYCKTRKPTDKLTGAFTSLGQPDLFLAVSRLLHWHKAVAFNIHEGDAHQLLIRNDSWYERYKILFTQCEGLTNVFELNKDRITFAGNVSTEEKQEITEYVHKYHKIPFSRTMYDGTSKIDMR